MTDDEKDVLVEHLVEIALKQVGPDEAPGVLWAALITAHLRNHSLSLAVLCIEHGLRELRQRIAASIRQKGGRS